MKLLIVAATHLEIAPLLEKMKIEKANNGHFFSSTYNKHSIDIVITGVGMTATAYYCSKHVGNGYQLVISVGIAGSFNKNLNLGEVVNVVEDCFSELGAEDGEIFIPIEKMGLLTKNDFPIRENGKIINNWFAGNSVLDQLPKVNGITVNTTHGNENSINKVINYFHPTIESMEGAAFLFVCGKEAVNCLQLRSISNYVEKRNRSTWKIELAIKNLNLKLIEILDVAF